MAKKKPANKKMWGGRFDKETNTLAEEFNASISFDKRLFRHDIRASIAHAEVLKKAGILSAKETKAIIKGLTEIGGEISSGKFVFSSRMEDIHMAVEERLTQKIGPLGGKLHTGRSRNDQVACDVRLYLKDEICDILVLLHGLKEAIVDVADKNQDAIMPGYTHLQRAQAVSLAHHMLAYYEMLKRDTGRFLDCLDRADSLPLGAGALAGSPYELDRNLAARLLGFSSVTENSIDSVSDRDATLEFLSASAILMMHLSRLSEEIIVWSSQEFGFVELSDEFSTGSSIMPQKKNPDIAELVRAKTGRVYGDLIAMLTVMKGLPLAYNKDMQEDKEPLFDAIDAVKDSLSVYAPMIASMKIKKDAMRRATRTGFLNATDVADYLTKKGMPFRQAHRVAGEAVSLCIRANKALDELTMEEWNGLSDKFGPDIHKAISIERSIESRKVYGGTAPKNVRRRLATVKKELEAGG